MCEGRSVSTTTQNVAEYGHVSISPGAPSAQLDNGKNGSKIRNWECFTAFSTPKTPQLVRHIHPMSSREALSSFLVVEAQEERGAMSCILQRDQIVRLLPALPSRDASCDSFVFLSTSSLLF